jgi:predicted Na+-dependent transporter
MASLLGRRFWITAYALLALGFWLPGDYRACSPLIPVLLGGILYFSCLKIALAEVVSGLRDGRLLVRVAGLSLVKLLLLPSMTYLVVALIAPAWAPGVTLVAMMPAGMSSLALADLYAGSRMAALVFTLVSSVLCPLSIPLLLAWLVPGSGPGMGAMLLERAAYVCLLLLAPFLLAQLTRALFPALIARHMPRLGYGSIGCACLLVFVSAAANRHHWATWGAAEFVQPLALICLSTAVTACCCWPFTVLLARAEAVSFACSSLYMNNGLAVALAVAFYQGDPHLLLPAILVQFPMIAAVAIIGGRWLAPRPPSG